MSVEIPSPTQEKSKPRRLLNKLGNFTREQFRRSKPGEEIPLPDDLRTKSGRNPRLLPTNFGKKVPELNGSSRTPFPGETGVPRALEYAQDIFPDKQFNLLSAKGSSAVVLESGDKVFKVMRDCNHYTYIENEIGALQTLHNEGLAPKPYVLIDSAREFRTNSGHTNSFGDVRVPRIDEGGHLPIIVMDKINAKPLDTLTDEQRIAAFDTFLEVGSRLDLSFGDTEFIVDGDTNRVVVIDTGGIARNRYGKYGTDSNGTFDRYPGLTEEEIKAASLTEALLHHLSRTGKPPGVRQIAEYLKNGDTEKIYSLLTEPSNRPPETEYNYESYKPTKTRHLH